MAHCTCLGGDHDVCDVCKGFESWDESLTSAQRGELAIDFIETRTVTCAETVNRSLRLETAFRDFLFDHYCKDVHGQADDRADAIDDALHFMGRDPLNATGWVQALGVAA